MTTAVKKGSYYKAKTKKWFEEKGYQVAHMERMMWIVDRKNDRMIPVKKDQMGADLLAVSAREAILIQVKLGRSNIAAGRTEFQKFQFPKTLKRQIIVWEIGAREPEIIRCLEKFKYPQ